MIPISETTESSPVDLPERRHVAGDPLRGVSLRQLRAFAVVARMRSFGRAASELHVSPSAISLQIKELETVMGLGLFVRDGRGIALSSAGEILLGDVTRALAALRDVGETAQRLRGQGTGAVIIGVVSNAKYFMPHLLARYRDEYPGVELRMRVGNREQLLRALCGGELDVAVMGTPPRELELRVDPFAMQRLGIIAACDHPLTGRRAIPVARIAQEQLLVRERGSGTRAAMEAFLAGAGVTPNRVMELADNETVKQTVMAGMGIAFISIQTSGLELREGLLAELDVVGLPLERPWNIVSARGCPLSGVAESLRQFVLERGAALLAQRFPSAPGRSWPADALRPRDASDTGS